MKFIKGKITSAKSNLKDCEKQCEHNVNKETMMMWGWGDVAAYYA